VRREMRPLRSAVLVVRDAPGGHEDCSSPRPRRRGGRSAEAQASLEQLGEVQDEPAQLAWARPAPGASADAADRGGSGRPPVGGVEDLDAFAPGLGDASLDLAPREARLDGGEIRAERRC
jgi:hypothetical protein